MTRQSRTSPSTPQLLQLAAIAMLVAVLTLNGLGASNVCGGPEAIMGTFVQQMVEHRNVLFPLDNCSQPMYKPPLFQWTATALDYVIGQNAVNAFNLRLPSALYAIAGAILTMVFALNLLGMRGAVLSGAILAGSYQYISEGRFARVDMTLTFFETLSLYAFFCWFTLENAPPAGRSKWLHYLFAIALGLGVLAKGPVGALLPASAVVVFLAYQRRWHTLRQLFALGPLLVGAALASSWYFACLIGRRFGFLSLQIGSENFGRFFGTLGAMPASYYVKPLLLNSGPLSLIAPAAVVAAFRFRRPPDADNKYYSQEEYAALCAKLFAIFWVVTVLFFQLAAFKRRAYLLPLWPPSAILLAWWTVDRVVPQVGMIAYQGLMATCLLLAVGNFFFVPPYEMRGCGKLLPFVEMLKWPMESLTDRHHAGEFQPNSFREAAARVNGVVGRNEPLYVFQIHDAIEPLVFYLDRCVLQLPGPLNSAPTGYILTTAKTWFRRKDATPQLRSILSVPYGDDGLVLLQNTATFRP